MKFFRKTRVLVVDDSAVVRKALQKELEKDNELEVIGTAHDPYAARDLIIKLHPDVLTLDIEMPRMDGLTFLKKLMKHYPLPIIIVSSLTPAGSELALEALAAGAIDVLTKPDSAYSIGELSSQLREKIKAAKYVDLKKRALLLENQPAKPQSYALTKTTDKVVVIGASTGGPSALELLLQQYPINAPGTVIAQHMPPVFTHTFAQRLDQICQVSVQEAVDGDVILPGRVLIAPGNQHLSINRSGSRYFVEIRNGPLVGNHRPSIDVLFHSAAKYLGKNAIGVILTGMGKDGVQGLLDMKNNGAFTIGQDEDSCIVYGMPKQAQSIGALQEILPLQEIAGRIIGLCNN